MVKEIVPGFLVNLRNLQMFATLSDTELEEIASKLVVKNYRKDEVILWQDDTNAYMYLVLTGRVKVVATTEDGKEIIKAIHGAGDSFGELSLLDCKTSPAEVVAMKETSAAIISKENFLKIIHTHEKVLDNLLHMFCVRLRESWERVEMVNFKNSEQRITMLLHQLAGTHSEKVAEGTLLNIRLTHQTLASMSGLTRETVSRTLDSLQKDNFIKIHKGDRKIILLPEFVKLESHL